MTTNITFIGMGEAGSAFVSGWVPSGGLAISAYDIKTERLDTAEAMRVRYEKLGVCGCVSAAEAVSGAELVFCTVTADQAVTAAAQAAVHLQRGALWCDCNSCAPSSKRQAAEVIEAVGAQYVDVAIMAPVHPKRNMTPLLIAGPHADKARLVLERLPMAPRVVAGEVGAASSIKMIRSVMVKGLEALTSECVLAAVAAGVEEEVLGSLMRSHPGTDWPTRTVYNLERMMRHGARRAAEMEEVARTLSDLGLPDDMARATVGWQRRLSETGLEAPEETQGLDAKVLANALLPKLRQ